MTPCKHPPRKLFSGRYWSPLTGKHETWVSCTACGDVIAPSQSVREAEEGACKPGGVRK